jgi:hypothetical protein
MTRPEVPREGNLEEVLQTILAIFSILFGAINMRVEKACQIGRFEFTAGLRAGPHSKTLNN